MVRNDCGSAFLIIAILVNNAFKTVQQRVKDKEDIRLTRKMSEKQHFYIFSL